MAKMGFEEEFDNFLDLMVRELVGVIGDGDDEEEDEVDSEKQVNCFAHHVAEVVAKHDGTATDRKDGVAKRDPIVKGVTSSDTPATANTVAKRDAINPAKGDTSGAVEDKVVNSAIGVTGTDEKSGDGVTRPKSGDRSKLITVEYTYTDETSDAKVTFPTKKDTHTAAEVSFALAYALADVTMTGVGRAAYKGEKEEIANKILQVIARELVKGSLMREIFKD